jgi:hypothetical protein
MEFVLILSGVANVVLLGLLLRRRACRETPRPEAGHQARGKEHALLQQLADELEVFQNYYFLWLIAARIALWTQAPEELEQAREMTGQSRQGLDRTLGFLRQHGGEFPPAVQALVDELLGEAQVDGLQPTAEVFNRKTEEANRITQRLRETIRITLG